MCIVFLFFSKKKSKYEQLTWNAVSHYFVTYCKWNIIHRRSMFHRTIWNIQYYCIYNCSGQTYPQQLIKKKLFTNLKMLKKILGILSWWGRCPVCILSLCISGKNFNILFVQDINESFRSLWNLRIWTKFKQVSYKYWLFCILLNLNFICILVKAKESMWLRRANSNGRKGYFPLINIAVTIRDNAWVFQPILIGVYDGPAITNHCHNKYSFPP